MVVTLSSRTAAEVDVMITAGANDDKFGIIKILSFKFFSGKLWWNHMDKTCVCVFYLVRIFYIANAL